MPQRFKGQPARATGPPPRAGTGSGRTAPAGQPVVRPPPGWVTALTCLLLALAVWAVFGQTLHYGFVNYDDNRFVFENSAITQGLSLRGVVSAFTHSNADEWYPLTSLSHMADWQLYGRNAGGHHLTNVLLHAATAILLFLALRSLTGAFWRSAFVAGVFALHPLRVESVAWVTERKDVLSGLFFVLTLWAYARYAKGRMQKAVISNQLSVISNQSDGSRNTQHATGATFRSAVPSSTFDVRLSPPSLFYLLALLFFALGLLSKTMLVTVPFVLLLLDYWPLHRLELSTLNSQLSTLKRLLIEKIPFLLLSVAAGVATILAQERAILLAQDLGLLSRIGNALVAYAVYVGQMLYPAGLAVLYPHPGNHLSVWTIGLCGAVLSLITAGVWRWRRQRPYLLVGWLWYLGMLLPVIGILQVGIQARADRYTYLPHLGLYLMAAWGAVDWAGAARGRRVALATAAVLILTGLLVLARVQTRYWRDSISLWTHTLACTSGNFVAHYNLGSALVAQGNLDAAIPHCERAIQLNPAYVEAHNNLGLALAHYGKWNEAIAHYERAIQLNPDSAAAHHNLGLSLTQQGRLAEAVPHYERALQLNPDYAEAHNNLGLALARQEKLAEAIPHYERALQLSPDAAEAHCNLGAALAAQGKLAEAVPHYERALQLNPDYAQAHSDFGVVLARQGRLSEAVPQLERALQLNPDAAEAHYNLGTALVAQGKSDAALQHFQQALTLATAQNNSALVEAVRAQIQSHQSPAPQPNN